MTYTEITSRKNKVIIECAGLCLDKKARDLSGLFPAEGIKLIEEAIFSGLKIKMLFFTQKALTLYGSVIEKTGCSQKFLVTDEVYAKLTSESAPQGIFACIEKPVCANLSDEQLSFGEFVLLEDIQNPLNIGAILRCCYSMGFEKVIFSKECADIYNPKCVRAAMGSLFKITPFFSDNLPEVTSRIIQNGNRVFCTSLDKRSKSLGSISFKKGDCFVIGNEGHGVSEKLIEKCSDTLIIPMNQGAESLNAATAAAIVMWEMKKQFLCDTACGI